MIGLFGGSFDPVHSGHVYVANYVTKVLKLEELRFIPCHIPPHKDSLIASASDRLQMLQLAVQQNSKFRIDDREIRRHSYSYTVDTLAEVREELGPIMPLGFILGLDAWQTLSQWSRWQKLLEYSHLIVVARPGFSELISGDVKKFVAGRKVSAEKLKHESAGRYTIIEVQTPDISATQIREQIKRGQPLQSSVLPDVNDYIQQHKLYR